MLLRMRRQHGIRLLEKMSAEPNGNNAGRAGVKKLVLLIDICQLPRTLGFVRCSTP